MTVKFQQTNQSGQVVLITLLVLTIATTIALSLISRTTTDMTITTQTEESARAFSAAEAGIEQALKGIALSGTQELSGGITYSVATSSVGLTTGVYAFPKKTSKNITETVWLVPHDDSTGALDESSVERYKAPSMDVCFSAGDSIQPALEVTVLYKQSTGEYEVAKTVFDPDSTRAAVNHFTGTAAGAGCGGSTGTNFKETITFASLNSSLDSNVDTLIALRLKPLFSATKIAVDTSSVVLPLQGKRIESIGTSISTNRKIIVYQQYKSPSSIFDAAVYSQGATDGSGGTFRH